MSYSSSGGERPAEKEAARAAHENGAARGYKLGRAIVWGIALVDVASSVASAVLDFQPAALAIQLFLSAFLVLGMRWARWVFAGVSGLSVFLYLFMLLGGFVDYGAPDGSWMLAAGLLGFRLLFSAAALGLLVFSGSVGEFYRLRAAARAQR